MIKARQIACCVTAGALLLAALVCIAPQAALAHAFPDHADPKVGATLTASPSHVRIWFDSALGPGSTITVHDAHGAIADHRDGSVSPADATLLEVSLPRLQAGTYRVIWRVVGSDGHKAAGDYAFQVK